MSHCEFCREFAGAPHRFQSLYGEFTSTRIIARTDRFVVLPTLGQLFVGSLLVLPIEHVETCAQVAVAAREEMIGLVDKMILRSKEFGVPLVFEHGATESGGGGCGIHHAHLHIVPIPRQISVELLFPEFQAVARDMDEAWRALERVDEYLLISAGKMVFYSDLSEQKGQFPSQFFRRRLVEHFNLQAPWDWRAYNYIEPALLRMIDTSLTTHVE